MCLSTGNRFLDIGLGVALGAVTAGVGFGVSAAVQGANIVTTGITTTIGSSIFGASTLALGGTTSMAAIAGGALLGGATSAALAMITPQQQNYNLAATGMPYTQQAYSSQHAKVTGSGGRQAAAVLASEIKQAKSLRKRQAEVADYGLGMDMAGTGLQIA